MPRIDPAKLPRHIAIIPDGNGRWAEARGLSREEGHRRGSDVVRDVVRASHELGVRMLTLYAFSQENWARPPDEVEALMLLLEHYLHKEADDLVENGIRVEAVGRLEELDGRVQRALETVIRRTEGQDEMRMVFALSYSGRAELVDAVRALARDVASGSLDPEAIDEKCLQRFLYAPHLPEPDLLIRSGGEHRVSNFLLWQLAYTEIYVTDALWPDFTKRHLVDALEWFQQRERRLGKTGAQVRAGV